MAHGDGQHLPDDVRWIREGREFRGTGRAGGSSGFAFEAPPRPEGGLERPSVGIQLLPPTWLRPPRAKDYHLDGVSTGLTAGNTPVVIPGTVLTVPEAYVGVVRSLELNVNSIVASTDIRWSLRFDNSPVEGWSDLRIFPGNIAAARRSFGPEELQLPIPEAATVDVLIEVLDAGTYTAGASFGGWTYSRDLVEPFEEAWRP